MVNVWRGRRGCRNHGWACAFRLRRGSLGCGRFPRVPLLPPLARALSLHATLLCFQMRRASFLVVLHHPIYPYCDHERFVHRLAEHCQWFINLRKNCWSNFLIYSLNYNWCYCDCFEQGLICRHHCLNTSAYCWFLLDGSNILRRFASGDGLGRGITNLPFPYHFWLIYEFQNFHKAFSSLPSFQIRLRLSWSSASFLCS